MIVSFLIPTRKRLQALLDGIESIKKNASPDVQVEILVRIDEDDHETLADRDRIPGEIIVGPRFGGYNNIYIFYNEMAAKSHGDWLVLWNDDTFMVTHHWDKLFPSIDPKNCAWVVWFQRGGFTFEFPVMTRKLYELWDCFAPASPADHYIHKIWTEAGKPFPKQPCKITIDHRRNEENIRALYIRPENVVTPPSNSFSRIDMKRLTDILRDTPNCL